MFSSVTNFNTPSFSFLGKLQRKWTSRDVVCPCFMFGGVLCILYTQTLCVCACFS